MCRRRVRKKRLYCRVHAPGAYLERRRLKEARRRARKSATRLDRIIRSEEPNKWVFYSESLGTGNLYAEPVKTADGKVDFSEEQRRIRNELSRLGLVRRATPDK